MGQAGVGKSEVDKSSLTTPGRANYSCPTYHANRESVRFRWEQPIYRHFHMSHNPFRVGGQPVEEMYGIMTKISSVSSQNQLLMLKNAPEFTKIMIGEICTSL